MRCGHDQFLGVGMGTIDERLGRDNSLNFIRLILAVLVIVSHAYPIGGFGPDPVLGDLGLGSVAVGGFFAISGYLITKSRFRTNLGKFALRRALRIFPGYWACVAFTAFIAASLAGQARGGWTFSDGLTFFALNAPMIRAGGTDIGTTLVGLPYAEAWNGSLWTLRYEVLCYVMIGLALALACVRRRRTLFLFVFAGVTSVSLGVHARGIDGVIADAALLAPFFLAGACLYMYSDVIPCSNRLALLGMVLFIAAVASGNGRSLAALPLAYVMMWLGIVLPNSLGKLAADNDFSYGTYLYAFPVQQLLVVAGAHHFGAGVYIVLCIAATAPLAVLSWFIVEKPAQRLAMPRLGTHGAAALQGQRGSGRLRR
jgi:peptidoglycan/LPS O-acetylase OafA/YrhL